MPADRPRDPLGRPLPRGAASAIPFEDYAAQTPEQNFDRGRAHFAAGRFFPAHEAWEEAWRQSRGTRDEAFFQALAQLGAAYTHIQRGNAHGARALLGRAINRLRAYGPHHRGLALNTILSVLEAQMEAAADAERTGVLPTLLAVPTL